MPDPRLPRGAPARARRVDFRFAPAVAAALFLAATFAVVGAPAARGEETTPARCALIDGRIVSSAEARQIAASWAPGATSVATADARAIADALQAALVPISDEGDALIAFVANGRVRDWVIVSPETWKDAVRAALGDPA